MAVNFNRVCQYRKAPDHATNRRGMNVRETGSDQSCYAGRQDVKLLFSSRGAVSALVSAAFLMGSGGLNAQTPSDPAAPSQVQPERGRLRHLIQSYYLRNPDKDARTPPLTSGQKFGIAALKSFDALSFMYAGAYAGIAQAENQSPSWGQGGEGYAKRYGAAFADRAIDVHLTAAVFPILFHEDPRYFRMAHGSFFHRAGYAVSRILITRTDAGSDRFNFSELAGTAAAAGIGVAYYPVESRTAGDTLQRFGGQLGTDALFNLFKEFWPDVRHHPSRRANQGTIVASFEN